MLALLVWLLVPRNVELIEHTILNDLGAFDSWHMITDHFNPITECEDIMISPLP